MIEVFDPGDVEAWAANPTLSWIDESTVQPLPVPGRTQAWGWLLVLADNKNWWRRDPRVGYHQFFARHRFMDIDGEKWDPYLPLDDNRIMARVRLAWFARGPGGVRTFEAIDAPLELEDIAVLEAMGARMIELLEASDD